MILVLTSADDATADYLCQRLSASDVKFVRLNTEVPAGTFTVSYDAAGPRLHTRNAAYTPQDFHAVWLRRPKPLSSVDVEDQAEAAFIARERSEAVEGFLSHIPHERWINHASANARASRKMEQLTRATELGLAVPVTIVTQSTDRLRQFWTEAEGRVIVKPLWGGYLERDAPEQDTQIFTCQVSPVQIDSLDDLARCPTLFQRLIDKASDVRVTIVDDAVHAVSLIASDDGQQRTDIRRDNMRDVRYEAVELPARIRDQLLSLVRSYGLRYAAIDLAVTTQSEWIFFEVNPDGQWAWLDLVGASDIGASFVKALAAR